MIYLNIRSLFWFLFLILGKKEEIKKQKGKREKQFRGTTKWMQSVIFECDDSLDVDKVCLKISSAEDNCLLGDLI